MRDTHERREAPVAGARSGGLTLPKLWAFTSVALPIVGALEAPMSSVDLAYQVRAGEIMLRTHSLLRTDPFSFTAHGQPWVDQQWGAQVLFALAWRAGGWAALALLRAALVGAIYLFVYLACRAAGAPRRRAALLTVASFAVSVGGLALRPQLLGMALFALSVYLVGVRRERPGALWALPAVVAAWSNLHGSFFLGPLLVALAFLAERAERSPRAGRTLAVAAASAAGSLLNPFGPKVWAYAAGLSTNPVITRFISEWQPPSLRELAGATFFLSVLAVGWLLARRDRPTPWPALLTLGLFFLIGLIAVRGIFWWALVAPAVVAGIWPAAGLWRPPSREATDHPSTVNLVIAAAVVLLGVSFVPGLRTVNPLIRDKDLLTNAPDGLTAELARRLVPGDRVFNPVPLGSWFEFALPLNPVFLDQRIEVFPPAVTRQHLRVSFGYQGWRSVLRRWRVRAVVADREEQARLIPLLRRDAAWRLVYEEGNRLLFVATK